MPTYSYTATNKSGDPVSGVVEASSPLLASAALRAQELFPQKIELAGASSMAAQVAPNYQSASGYVPTPEGLGIGEQSKIDAAPFLVSVPLGELAVMYRQLATLLRSGVPMLQSLTALASQTRHSRLKAILNDACSAVASGNALSSTFARHPAVFTSLQVELIRAGEASGMLEGMCTRLADYLERELEIRRKLKRETLYPKIVLAVAGLVLLVVGFAQAGMGQAGVASVVAKVEFAAITAALIFGVWWLARYLNQFPAVGAAWDNVKMMIPGAGGVSRRYATARFTRALGALYSGGILLPRAVEIAARACGNRAIGQRMLAGVPVLMNGGGVSAMLESTNILSPIAVQMARTGEQTGSLDTMLEKVADYLESEADMKAHQLAVYAGVAMLLIAAIVVGIIAVSFYSGMFSNTMRTGEGGGDGG